MKLRIVCILAGFLFFVLSAAAQTASSGAISSQVPPLIQFSSVATDEGGNTLSGVANITFSLYAAQQGGEPLWTETQNNVLLDPTGRYSVQLGITQANGVPTTLFNTGEARWLGVQIAEQAQQPRVLLLSVPYALKAGDAATIGGLPPSAFMLATPAGTDAASTISAVTSAPQGSEPPAGTITGTGTADFIPLWTTTSNIASSVLFQSGTGSTARVGVGTTTPASTLDVKGGGTIRGTLTLPAIGAATATAGRNSQPLSLAASAFNSSSSTALNQTFQWQSEPASNDTAAPSGTLNLLFGEGATKPSETGLHIASDGQITFATGQNFPGTGDGTITAVTAGSDLTGGGSSGAVTLNVDTTKVPLLAAANTFTGIQTINNTTFISGSNSSGVLQVTNTATSGTAPGVNATTDSTGASAVRGNAVATTGTASGVFGNSSSSFGEGVLGTSPNVGIAGASQGGSLEGEEYGVLSGVWGDTGGPPQAYTGILGTADENYAAFFINNSSSTDTVYMENDAESSSSAVILETDGGNFPGVCTINVSGDLDCNGTISGVVPTDGGARKVSLYSTQSTENWFEDAGSGQLASGSVHIALDSTFAQTVNTGVEYHVFLTPKGDCEGLYVTNETPEGFDVHELRGGHSGVAFDYRIMGKRAGYENVRLGDVTQRYQMMEKQHQQIRLRKSEHRHARAEAVPMASAAIASPR
jgi:hypothetical protein